MRFDEVTGSTQATALALAEDGAPEWTLVAAGHQTAGRGRLGRTWLDEPGALLFSVVLRPSLEPEHAGVLALLAGLAMAETLGGSGVEAGCKWPNDLLVGEEKVGGILAEAKVGEGGLEHVALGLGVNLGVAPEVAGAGSVAGPPPADVLSAFLETFAADYRALASGQRELTLGRYRRRCITLGRRVRATTVYGEEVVGEAVDVDGDGGLVLRVGEGVRTVRSGEVEHLRPPALPG